MTSGISDQTSRGLLPGLRNPREHGSAAPRKELRMTERNRRIFEKKISSEKEKMGLKMLQRCIIIIMILFPNMA